MTDRSSEILCERLGAAKRPEDIFGAFADGPLDGQLKALKHLFREFVKLVHPDQNPTLPLAARYFVLLTSFWREAESLLKVGTYGKERRVVLATLRSKSNAYEVLDTYRVGEVADLLLAETEAKARRLLKIVRIPSDNDLLDTEARALGELLKKTDKKAELFLKYLPNLVEAFTLIEDRKHRRVNVFEVAEGFFSLAEIRSAYPDGLDARDVAWMLRRTFGILGWIHSHDYVHGAALPEHILVHPADHGAKLVGWSYSVRKGQRITAISASRKAMYPASVLKKEPAKFALDVQMTAESAILLLSEKNGTLKSDVPKEIGTFLSGARSGAVKDGWDAYRDFDSVLTRVYGKRKYRPLAMPPRV